MAIGREFKFKVGEVEHTATVPEDWVHKTEVDEGFMSKTKFQEELKRRVDGVTKGMVKSEDALKDEEFLTKAAEANKEFFVKLLEIKPGKEGDVDVAKLQKEAMDRVRQEELKPVQEASTKKDEEIQRLRLRDLDGQIATAAITLGVDPELTDLVKIHVRDNSIWSQELNQWLVKRQDGSGEFEFSTDPDKPGGHPYMGPAEFLEVTKKGGKKKVWFKASTQAGIDFKGDEFGADRAATLDQFKKLTPAQQTEFHGKDPTKYAEFMSQISAAGESALMTSGDPLSLAGKVGST